MSEISIDLLSELLFSVPKTDKCNSGEIKRRTQYTNVAESLLFGRLFKAAHDLTPWPSG